MATQTYDPSSDADFVQDQANLDAENEAIGGQLQDLQDSPLAGKFQTTEELEAGYRELERLLGQRNREEQPTEEPTEEGEQVDTEESEEEPEGDNSEFVNALLEEFNSNEGQFTEETLEYLQTLDSVDVANAFLEAGITQQAQPLAEDEVDQLQGIVGGPEAYTELTTWARDNLSEAVNQAYDEVMNSSNVNAIYFAIQALNAQYHLANPGEQELITGRNSSDARDVYRSQGELLAAQNDPRYEYDEAYRQDVFDKLSRSGDLY